jgi:antitoxin YefM
MEITADEARKHLSTLIRQVLEGGEPVTLTSSRGDAVLISRADYDALSETAYLMRTPANATRLIESRLQSQAEERLAHDLVG